MKSTSNESMLTTLLVITVLVMLAIVIHSFSLIGEVRDLEVQLKECKAK